jgi:hypothetical protein
MPQNGLGWGWAGAGLGLGWGWAGLGWGLQTAAKQSGRSFLHPAAAARGCGAAANHSTPTAVQTMGWPPPT